MCRRDPNGSNIPLARKLLERALLESDVDSVKNFVKQARGWLYRAPCARKRAPDVSARITPRVARAIRVYARAHPDMPLQKIGERFHTNSGRVSEALHGLR